MAGNGDRGKVISLVEHICELREQESALIQEVMTILAGGEPLGMRLKKLKAQWCDLWQERHKEKCAFDHVSHTGGLKKKLLTYGDDVVRAKMVSYLASDDPYYVRARHPFGLFLKTFDTWRGIPHEHLDPSAETRDRLQGLRGHEQ